jgi:hypothetical protein
MIAARARFDAPIGLGVDPVFEPLRDDLCLRAS